MNKKIIHQLSLSDIGGVQRSFTLYFLHALKKSSFSHKIYSLHNLINNFSDLKSYHFKNGETLTKENEGGDQMFILLEGNASVYKFNEEKQKDEKLARWYIESIMFDFPTPFFPIKQFIFFSKLNLADEKLL